MKWSEIFDNFSHRYDFLMEKLKFEQSLWIDKHKSADDAVESLKDSSAKMDEPVIPRRRA